MSELNAVDEMVASETAAVPPGGVYVPEPLRGVATSYALWYAYGSHNEEPAPMPKLGDRTPMSERLLSKIDRQPNDGCWLWTGAKNGYGYGTLVTADLKKIRAHRAAFVEFKAEPLGPNDVVMHTCDVPACINPAHLVKGSKLTNNRDAKEKGRNAKHETNGRARLTEDQVAAIRECAGVLPQKLLARLAGIDASAISRIIAGLRWEP